ncbi:hypothetical protein KTI76_14495, partial [Acinetobacter baumannii]|nr:hypothetical protein [Acinetobacter baumannii]
SHRQLIILNTPISKEVGVFFYMGNQSEKNYLNIELQIIFGCLHGSMDIMRKFFYFWCPREN